MGFMRIRKDFSEVDKLLEGIDPSMVKITGSYLWYPRFTDIDCTFYDPSLIWKITRNANKCHYRVDIKLVTKEEFDKLEDLNTFKNFCMCYHNGKVIFSDNYVDSQYLEFNPDSVGFYNNAGAIREKIRKNLSRGFLIRN